jgi:hypothetical protein
VWAQVGDQVGAQVKNIIWPYWDGNLDSNWLGFYDFFLPMVTIENGLKQKLLTLHRVAQETGSFTWALNGVCVISERPTTIKMVNKRLHCDGGPAVQYEDGLSVWCLNGVRVPKWLAETAFDKIDCSEFAKIDNAEVRREFVRKVGIERIASKMGARSMDKQGNYDLLEIDLGGRTGKWPCLKMLNPSIGVWHLEFVDKACRTVEQALTWRNGTELRPKILT